MQSALARIRAAQAELSVQRTLDYPNINIDGTENRELVSNDYLYPKPFGGSWQWVGDTEARFRWSLDFWGKQAAQIERARNASEGAALDANAAKLALAGMFAQSYVELLLAWQNIDIAHETVAERQTILDLTQSRVKAGLENEASLEQAKALLAMSRIEVRRSEAQRDMAVHAIAALIGAGRQGLSRHRASRGRGGQCLAVARSTCLPICWRGGPTYWRPMRASARPCMAARPPMPISIPISIWRRRSVSSRSGWTISLPARRWWPASGRRSICRCSMPAASAPNMPAPPPILMPRWPTTTARWSSAVRQTSDALTQVASLADQRQQQQLALDSAARAFDLAKERYRLGLSGQIPMLTAEATLLSARQQMAALVGPGRGPACHPAAFRGWRL